MAAAVPGRGQPLLLYVEENCRCCLEVKDCCMLVQKKWI